MQPWSCWTKCVSYQEKCIWVFLLDSLRWILAVALLCWLLILVDQKVGIKVITRVTEVISCLSQQSRLLIRINTERGVKTSRSTGAFLGVVHVIAKDGEHRLWQNKGTVNRTSCLDDQALGHPFVQQLTPAESQPK